MSDPVRLRDDPLVSDELRDLLGSFPGARGDGRPTGGSGLRPMSSAERARATRRVAVIAALPITAGGLFGAKGIAVAAVLFAGSAVGVRVGADAIWSASSQPAGASDSVSSPAGAGAAASTAPTGVPSEGAALPPAADAPVEPTPIRAPIDEPARPSSTPPRGTALAIAGAGESSADTLLEEVAVLESARSLVASDPAGALRKIEEHQVRFPTGKLSVERELIAVDALARAGRSGEARARADALLARTEGGLYEQRVRALIATLD